MSRWQLAEPESALPPAGHCTGNCGWSCVLVLS